MIFLFSGACEREITNHSCTWSPCTSLLPFPYNHHPFCRQYFILPSIALLYQSTALSIQSSPILTSNFHFAFNRSVVPVYRAFHTIITHFAVNFSFCRQSLCCTSLPPFPFQSSPILPSIFHFAVNIPFCRQSLCSTSLPPFPYNNYPFCRQFFILPSIAL